jgi:Ion channel
LLLLLVFSYLCSAFASGSWVSALQITLFVGVATLGVRAGRIGVRAARQAVFLAVGGSAVAVVLALTHSADAGAGVADLWTGLLLLFTVVLLLRRVLVQPAVTVQSIFGAVSAYMIIGLMFAAFYAAAGRFGGHGFFAHGQPGNLKTYQYFSFTTLTTLGYGDFTAASSGGRALAVMEAMAGQVFLATLVARLMSAFRVPSRQRADGPAEVPARYAWPARHLRPARRARSAGQAPAVPGASRTSPRARERPARRSRPRPGR